MKLISIILPYYKKKIFIQQTLNSILAQNYKKYEIIIIYDDPDKTDLFYLKKKIKQDKRIKLLINKKNMGAGKSRNKGINIARGHFLAFIDADDIWHPNKLYLQLNFMLKHKINASHTSYNIIDKDNNKIGLRKANTLSFEQLKKSCDIGLSTVMLKKNIIKKNQLFGPTKTKEDYIFWLNIAKRNHKFFSIKKALTSWRKLENSLSSPVLQKLSDAFYLYNVHLKENYLKALLSTIVLSLNFLKK